MLGISILKKLEEKMHPLPLRERVSQALFRLQTQHDKLDHLSAKLHQRDQDMFQRCIGAQLAKDVAHANIYASECAEIRKMAHIVLSSQLALERVVLRLQTVEEFGDLLVQIAPVVSIVKETRGKIAGIIPEVANELEEVTSTLTDMSIDAGPVETHETVIEASNEEAKKVLEESSMIAEQKIKERFPEIPPMETHATSVDEDEEIVLTENGEQVSFDEEVLDYIVDRKGSLSISECASSMGTSTDSVRKAVERLRDRGRITLE